ncbi:hypothetical protein ACA29_05855 [Lederbergia galactosidilytica]|uniref:Uncharacterized protein n=1 Tax=Lederbergia galactosidilytica TaxID=217031 RepID=A0A0Q9Y0W0_9BACI|nr:hypothetical protein [Lederbergia galactosidilytica]KRG14655.1 hypothetical protein ACA29_05855 [Lederbergia galactosidilytica]
MEMDEIGLAGTDICSEIVKRCEQEERVRSFQTLPQLYEEERSEYLNTASLAVFYKKSCLKKIANL